MLLGRKRGALEEADLASAESLLIERCQKKDPAAFASFIDQYQARIFGFVRRMVGSAEEAEDITQEVFIRAFQHFHRFDSRCSVKSWLFRIAHNLCIDHSRRAGRLPSSMSLNGDPEAESELEIADESWSPETVAIRQELLDHVEAAVAAMSEKLRAVLLLHDREDMGYGEIAEMLGIPEGTVKSRLFLARAYLQNRLASEFSGAASSELK